jgi:hypothetical protein
MLRSALFGCLSAIAIAGASTALGCPLGRFSSGSYCIKSR